MGLWQFHPVNDPNVPVAERRLLERAAQDGWLWWLTPDEDLRLVHATARPGRRTADLRLDRRTPQARHRDRQPRRRDRRARRQHREGRVAGDVDRSGGRSGRTGAHRRAPRRRSWWTTGSTATERYSLLTAADRRDTVGDAEGRGPDPAGDPHPARHQGAHRDLPAARLVALPRVLPARRTSGRR